MFKKGKHNTAALKALSALYVACGAWLFMYPEIVSDYLIMVFGAFWVYDGMHTLINLKSKSKSD